MDPTAAPLILLVDDDVENARPLELVLRSRGHELHYVPTGEMALMLARKRAPNLVLLDSTLPDMNGYQVCERLKADPATRAIPVIFVSAGDEPLDRMRAFQLGGADYLTTPFQMDEVCARIETQLALQKLCWELEAQTRTLETQVARRTEQIRRSEERRKVLLEINNALIQHVQFEPLFQATTEALSRILAFERASLVLLDEEGQGRVTAFAGLEVAHDAAPVGSRVGIRMPRLRAAKQPLPSVVKHDLATEGEGTLEARLLQAGLRTYVTVPLVTAHGAVGLLNVASVEPGRYRQGEVALLEEFGHQLALAVENMQAFQRLEDLTKRLRNENAYLTEEITAVQGFDTIIGRSPSLKRTLQQIAQVAPTDATVLILGESGTGKELVAREIHQHSRRRERALIRVNCAAVPKELFESEFFGHVRGAFTGAVRDRVGRFELADGGTLLLDEVGEIPLELQGKLLRVLQEGQYERVGEEKTRTVDVRVIAATNRDLEREVVEGRFRRDLFYRLNVFPIALEPLRNRRDDIPLLAEHFLAATAKRLGRDKPRLTEPHLAVLSAYDWPGNVRELQSIIERAVITLGTGGLCFDVPLSRPVTVVSSSATVAAGEVVDIVSDDEMQRRVRENMEAALARCGGKIYGPDGAARLLGLPPTTLSNRIRRMGLMKDE